MKISPVQANISKVNFNGLWRNICDAEGGVLTSEKRQELAGADTPEFKNCDTYCVRTYYYKPFNGESDEKIQAAKSLVNEKPAKGVFFNPYMLPSCYFGNVFVVDKFKLEPSFNLTEDEFETIGPNLSDLSEKKAEESYQTEAAYCESLKDVIDFVGRGKIVSSTHSKGWPK